MQSSVPMGMWFAGVVTIVTLANGPTVGPWQLRHPVTPWWVPVTEYWASLPVVWHCAQGAVVGM